MRSQQSLTVCYDSSEEDDISFQQANGESLSGVLTVFADNRRVL